MNNNWICGVGPTNAKLMCVGEAPGAQEEAIGKPFVGPSGELLTELLEVAGSSRSQVYITNVVKLRPPNNDLERLGEINNPNRDYNSPEGIGYKVEDFLPLLWNEIDALKPNCILALGSLACEILTGKKGIKNWRGSIVPCVNFDIKVVPTIHPAALFQRNYGKKSEQGMFSWKQKAHIQFDVIKAVRESQTSSWDSIPKRSIDIVRSSIQLEQFFNMYRDYNKVYVDTEVFKAHLVCIGFAFTPYHGISVPLIDLQSDDNHQGVPLNELVDIWMIVADKLADARLKKVGQNFKADKVYWLEKAGFEVNGFIDDTMFKMHTLSSELPKSQAFQASIFTNEPFYKYEGKEYNPHKDKLDVLLRYNGRDCVVNCECDQEMQKDIEELGLNEFHQEMVLDLYPIYEKIEKRGWLVDKEKQKELYKHYDDLLNSKKQELKELLLEFGVEVEVNYNSPKQVGGLLFGCLKLPDRDSTDDKTLTKLANNAVKNPKKRSIIYCILDLRSIHKLKETYVNARTDMDNRMRWTYNQVGTETGRTSTSIIQKPLRNGKWGVPIQTIPRPDEFGGRIREMYIADPGKILVEFDQSQADARIVALLANDLDLLALFDILDIHRLTASFCYGLTSYSGEELITAALAQHRHLKNSSMESYLGRIDFSFLDLVTEEQRQIGKATRHGLGFDLGEEGLSIKMKISLYRAKQSYQKVHEMSPKIKEVYHEDIQAALADNNKVLMTPFGRRREFFERWGKELFREAYAHIPQSTVGDNTKRAMKEVDKIDWVEILAEMHDSFVAQIEERRVEEYYHIVKPIWEQPIDFERCTLKRQPITIPVDFKVGYSWGTMSKMKFD